MFDRWRKKPDEDPLQRELREVEKNFNTYLKQLEEMKRQYDEAAASGDHETAQYYGQAAERIVFMAQFVVTEESLMPPENRKGRYEKVLSNIEKALQRLQEIFGEDILKNAREVAPLDMTLAGVVPDKEKSTALVKGEQPVRAPEHRVAGAIDEATGYQLHDRPLGSALSALDDFYRIDLIQMADEFDVEKEFDQRYAGALYKALRVDQKFFSALKGRTGAFGSKKEMNYTDFYRPAGDIAFPYRKRYKPKEEEASLLSFAKSFGFFKARAESWKPPEDAAKKNYYQILGIARDADEKEIKRAYRLGALRYHPDRHPNDPEAEARFKEIGEAYEVLSDPERRRTYDKLREPA